MGQNNTRGSLSISVIVREYLLEREQGESKRTLRNKQRKREKVPCVGFFCVELTEQELAAAQADSIFVY